MILSEPKISYQELVDIQKIANQGLLAEQDINMLAEKDSSIISKSPTAHLMESYNTNRDELISNLTRSKKNASLLGKRARPTTDKLMKQA